LGWCNLRNIRGLCINIGGVFLGLAESAEFLCHNILDLRKGCCITMKNTSSYTIWAISLGVSLGAGFMLGGSSLYKDKSNEGSSTRHRISTTDLSSEKKRSKQRQTSSGGREVVMTDELLEIGDKGTRLKKLIDLVGTLSSSDLMRLLEKYTQKHATEVDEVEFQIIVDALVYKSATKALDDLRSSGNSKMEQLSYHGARCLGTFASGEALQWLANLPIENQSRYRYSIILGISETNIALAMHHISEMDHRESRFNLVSDIDDRLATLPMEDIWRWYREYADQALPRLISKLPQSSFPRAAELIDGLDNKHLKGLSRLRLVNQWVKADLAAAQEWVEAVPREDVYPLVQHMIDRTNAADSEEFIGWLQRFEDLEDYPSIVRKTTEKLIRIDPVRAAKYYKDHPNQAHNGTRHWVKRVLEKKDPKAALEFMQSTES